MTRVCGVAAEHPPGDPEDLQTAGVTDAQKLPGAGGRVMVVPVDQVLLPYAGAGQLQRDPRLGPSGTLT